MAADSVAQPGAPTFPAPLRVTPRRVLALAAGGAGAAASLLLALQGTSAAAAVNAITVGAIAAMLVYGPRRSDPLHSTRWLLLGALAVTFLASLMSLGYQTVSGHPPARPWIGDSVALLYAPLLVAGLLIVPSGGQVKGYRIRALTDGVLAGGALWYLIAAVGGRHFGASFSGELGRIVAVLYAAGDVCILATAATVLSHCAPAVTRTVGGIAAGMTLITANDVWVLAAGASPAAPGPTLLLEGGLLLLLLAAAIPALPEHRSSSRPEWVSRLIGAVPFLPLLAAMVVTTRLVIAGRPIPGAQVLPALVVAVALTARSYVSSRDKGRLLDELREREAGLEAALRRDPLTGLANRLGLSERLSAALADPRQRPVAVALLDLNDFKVINDTHGHAVGDALLQRVGHRLAGELRADDLVVRLGGDEFAVIAGRLGPAQRDRLAERLLRPFQEPIDIAGQRFRITSSIGIVFAEQWASVSELLAQADAAMYRSKEEKDGTSAVTVLDDRGRTDITRHLQIREAIADPDLSQFDVHYQPVVHLITGEIDGFEALLRWNHPELGPIPPDVFIPLAEQAGSIVSLGRHVLRRATRDLATLQHEQPHRTLNVGVNVSPHQLTRESFVTTVLSALEESGVPPRRLKLEITEQAFTTHIDAAADTVACLAEADVEIAIDDFGTGYSNLRYLQRLHPGIVKLDRSFVADMSVSPSTRELVKGVAAMAATLGLTLLAEGIETPDQLHLLQDSGFVVGQGYLFSRPVPLDEAAQLLHRPAFDVGRVTSG